MTMSKSNDVSTLYHRPLADSELDAVSGGIFPGLTNIITDATGDAVASAAGKVSQEMGTPQFFGWFFW
jgi:hypothetical protein